MVPGMMVLYGFDIWKKRGMGYMGHVGDMVYGKKYSMWCGIVGGMVREKHSTRYVVW